MTSKEIVRQSLEFLGGAKSKILKFAGIRKAGERDLAGRIPARAVLHAAQDGDALACAIVDEAAASLGVGIANLELITGERIRTIHIVGGGTKNVLLSRFIAGATGRTVVAGPVEATTIGNIMVQAQALGFISTIEDARSIVRKSFPLVEYRPEDAAGWDEAYARFEKLLD